ncbi:uncharacterized protein [Aegilops tauschii subsp. strangulata]|uniref:uncharacterized protein n=1 Tax=Aegilops tauschii subsp. strangulata TaxID=200361 RepID=UPI00098AB145
MASTGDESKQPPEKRARHDGAQAAPAPAPARVQLNPADCNLGQCLHFHIPRNSPRARSTPVVTRLVSLSLLTSPDFIVGHGGLRGHALHGGAFAYCWSGARATAGVRGGGKYCFGCWVLAEQPVEMEDTDAGQRHLCRVGVSRGDDPVGGLGEAGGQSFAFGGTGGKPRHDGNLIDDEFGVGDTVVCAVDLDARPMASIGFAKNGQWLGIALPFDASQTQTGLGLVDAPVKPMPWESAIFPHVLLKNVMVDMQFSMEDGLEPVNGYQPWSSLLGDGNAVLGPAFAEQRECERDPGDGWPPGFWEDYLGREVCQGASRETIRDSRDQACAGTDEVVNGLLRIAENVPRNYILDQANVERIPRIRLLNRFSNFGRKTAVVVFPSPAERKSRSSKRFRETWKEVSDEEVNKMSVMQFLPLNLFQF